MFDEETSKILRETLSGWKKRGQDNANLLEVDRDSDSHQNTSRDNSPARRQTVKISSQNEDKLKTAMEKNSK